MIRFAIAKIAFFFYYRYDLLRGKDGTAYPGRLLMKLCPDFNKMILKGIDCILVTGTNGKTTTTKMIASLLKANGIRCIYNYDGGNLVYSIAASLARQISIFNKHKIKKVVLECDERHVKEIAEMVDISVIVVTTMDKDYSFTHLSVDEFVKHIKDGIETAKGAVICMNEADNYNISLREFKDRKYIYYKMLDDHILVDGESFKLELKMRGRYNLENAAAALSAAKSLDLLNDKSINAICDARSAYGRFETIEVRKCKCTIALIKNPAGCKAVCEEILDYNLCKERILFLGFFREDDFMLELDLPNHLEFEKMNKKFDEIYVLDNHELINKYLDGKGIVIDYKMMIEIIENLDEPVIMALGYYAMFKVRKMLVNRNYVKDFWCDPN